MKELAKCSIHHYFKQFYSLAVTRTDTRNFDWIKEFHGIAINSLTPVQLTEGIAREAARRYLKAKNNNKWGSSGRDKEHSANAGYKEQGSGEKRYTRGELEVKRHDFEVWKKFTKKQRFEVLDARKDKAKTYTKKEVEALKTNHNGSTSNKDWSQKGVHIVDGFSWTTCAKCDS